MKAPPRIVKATGFYRAHSVCSNRTAFLTFLTGTHFVQPLLQWINLCRGNIMAPSNKLSSKRANGNRVFVFGLLLSLVGFTLNFHTFRRLMSLQILSEPRPAPPIPRRDRSRRRRRRTRITTPKQSTDRESVALLISGQCHRFIYREQSGPLFQTTSESATPFTLDVYITLQCGGAQKSLVGQVDAPPYMGTLNMTDIKEWYTARGADSVTIQILDPEHMDNAFEETQYQATTVYRNNFGHKLSYMIGWPRWIVEVRKFYSRHVTFAMTLQAKQTYSAYVFWREDNYFFTPIDMEQVFFSKNKSKDEPFVIVDEHCEFHAYSDKIYIANHLGAAILFSSTKAEFFSWMKRYALFGFYRMHYHGDPLQPETFVHESLLKANVEKQDLLRIDVRYVDGVKCVPHLYFYCMPEATRNLATQHNLVVCPKTDGAQLSQPSDEAKPLDENAQTSETSDIVTAENDTAPATTA
jgi:hypothetical protein